MLKREAYWICRTVNRIQTLLHSGIYHTESTVTAPDAPFYALLLYRRHSVPVFINLFITKSFENVKIKKKKKLFVWLDLYSWT